ncbi:MAG: glucosyl-3-phosphoglycerate synthase [Solirubrobacterales bacterium]
MVSGALPPVPGGLAACVVVPARDEEDLIGGCIAALAAQRGVDSGTWEVILVLDGCSDSTEDRAREAAHRSGGPALMTVESGGAGAGGARALGMEIACRRLEEAGAERGLIATTDADSRVADDWLRNQLAAVAAGAEAIGGAIELDPVEASGLSAPTLERRGREHSQRMLSIAGDGPTEHPHFAGASIGVTPRAFRAIGGMEARPALEDEALAARLRRSEIEIHRLAAVRVATSARTDGRALRGLSRDLQVSEWVARRTWDGSDFDVEALAASRSDSVSVVLPAREVAGTIGTILDRLRPLGDVGLFDELIVVDASSADGTAAIARDHGAVVLDESELLPEFGPALGKGDAMWRAAAHARGDVLAFLDADTVDFDPGLLTGLLGPIITDPGIDLVKGAFERPFSAGDESLPGEGGRVTELIARPLLNFHFPELAGIEQPLAGETAVRRELFARLPIPVGYGVEIAMLIDVARERGADAIAQSRLGVRQNRHQPLRALSLMAYQVLAAAERRIGRDGAPGVPGPMILPAAGGDGIERALPACEERPPLAAVEVATADVA